MESNCPLCLIPQKETLLYEDDKIYLASTKTMKGHKVRVMAVTKRHTTEPTFEEQILVIGKLIEYMSSLMLNGQDWFIVSNKFASVPQHFHFVAVDESIDGELDPFFFKTPKVVFPIRSK